MKALKHPTILFSVLLLILVVAGAAGWRLTHPADTHKVSTMLHLSPKQYLLAEPPPWAERQAEHERFVRNQKQLITSDLIMEPVFGDPRVLAVLNEYDETPESLKDALIFERYEDSDFFSLSFVGPEAKMQDYQVVVNRIVEEYLRLRGAFEQQQVSMRLSALDQQRLEREEEIRRRRQLVQELHKQAKGVDPYNKLSEENEQKLNTILDRIESTEIQLALQEAKLAALKTGRTQSNHELSASEIERQLDSDPILLSLAEQRSQLSQQLAEVESDDKLGKSSPQYQQVLKRLDELKEAANKRNAELRMATVAESMDLKRSIEDSKLLAEVLNEHLKEQIKKFPNHSSEALMALEFEQQELDRVQRVCNQIKEKILSIKTEREAPGGVQLLNKAGVGPID